MSIGRTYLVGDPGSASSCTIDGKPGGGARIFASIHSDGQRCVRIDVGGGSLSIFLTPDQAYQLANVLLSGDPA